MNFSSNLPSSETDGILRSAVEMLRKGQYARALQLLRPLAEFHPKLIGARWLLAGAYFEIHDYLAAQRELRVCIALDPGKAHPYVLLGRALLSMGQLDEAIQVLHRAAALDPEQQNTALILARALLMQRRSDEAHAITEPLIRKGAADPELLLLHSHALMDLGRVSEAIPVLRHLVRIAPTDREARFRLAAALADSGRAVEAETVARAAMVKAAKTPEAHYVLARALIGQNKLDAAETELREAVRLRPDYFPALSNLAELAWMRAGDVEEASAELDAALRINPWMHSLRISKAKLLLAAQLSERALSEIEQGLRLAETDLALLNAASRIALDFDSQRGLAYARRAQRVAPENPSALITLGNALLSVGQAAEALEIAEKLYQLDANDGQAIALQAGAWRMLGDSRYLTIFDYQHLVRAQLIDVPDGWMDLRAYLNGLKDELLRLHISGVHPIGQSLRRGSQVELDFERPTNAALRAFPQAIERPIREYINAIGKGDDPLRRRNLGAFRVRGGWSVRLRPNGFHVNHYHPEGWLSSACYIDLPSRIDRPGGEGWLQFGEPGFPTRPPLPAEYFLKPEPGLLALFPSYMWHGTVPFSGSAEEARLSIAFDVLPA